MNINSRYAFNERSLTQTILFSTIKINLSNLRFKIFCLELQSAIINLRQYSMIQRKRIRSCFALGKEIIIDLQ